MLTAVWNGAKPWFRRDDDVAVRTPCRSVPTASMTRCTASFAARYAVRRYLLVPGDLGLVLAGADGRGVGWIGRLPRIGEQELVLGAVRLLEDRT